jgi:hypothetical protein
MQPILKIFSCFAPNLTPVCERCVCLHIILMFFIWSGNHKFYIQFLRLLGLQSFIITLYKVHTYYNPLIFLQMLQK